MAADSSRRAISAVEALLAAPGRLRNVRGADPAPAGSKVEAFGRRLSRQAKSRAQPRGLTHSETNQNGPSRPELADAEKRPPRSLLHTAFEAGITLKGLDGLLEVVGGVLLGRVNPATLNRIVAALTQHELSEDPHDFVARHLVEAARHFGQGQRLFAALYLLVHGVVKVGLVAALWRNKLWAYPALIGVIAAFIAYQLYRLSRAPTLLLVALTVFDVAVLWLTWAEYRRVSPRRK